MFMLLKDYKVFERFFKRFKYFLFILYGMDKKKFVGFFMFVLILFSSVGFVKAESTMGVFDPVFDIFKDLFVGAFNVLKIPLSYLLGAPATLSDDPTLLANLFLAKLLLAVLLFAVVSSILKNSGVDFLSEGFSHWVVAIVVPILAVRFLTPAFIETILLPYSVIGVVLTSIVPFVLYFFFVEKGFGAKASPAFRKAAWIFFGAVFFAMWVLRRETLYSEENGVVYAIYPMVVLLSLLAAFMDGTIQKIFRSWEVSRRSSRAQGVTKIYYSDLLNECHRTWNDAVKNRDEDSYIARYYNAGVGTGRKAYARDITELEKKIKSL